MLFPSFLNKFRLWKRDDFFVSIVGIATILGLFFPFWFFFQNGFFQMNLELQNILFQSNTLSAPARSVVIVGIDDKTLKNKEEGGLGRWQDFKRSYYVQAIKNLQKYGATVVGIDVLFSETSTDKRGDADLAGIITQKENSIVTGMHLQTNENDALVPYFGNHSEKVGFLNVRKHTLNNAVNSIDTSISINENRFWSFAFLVSWKYFNHFFGTQFFNENAFVENFPVASFFWNYAGPKLFFIDWATYQGKQPFNEVSFLDVYNDTPPNKNLFSGKIVLIWATANTLGDMIRTPVGTTSGVYAHAQAINTLLSNRNLFTINTQTEIGILLIYLLLCMILWLQTKNVFASLGIFVGGIGIFFVAYLVIFFEIGGIFNHGAEFLLLSMASFLFVVIYRYMREKNAKSILKNALTQYVSEDIAREILENEEELSLWAKRKLITTCFSDIAGFTSLAEDMSPEKLLDFLSIYLKNMSDIVFLHRWFINKYEGDAIMALWGVFGNEENQTYLACTSALAQIKKLQELNEHFLKEFGFTLQIRLWINTGEAIIGNIGSLGKKIEFTALWDSINTASRLEGINKIYGTSLCVSFSTYQEVKDIFFFRKLDTIYLKGKATSTEIYELIDFKEKVNEQKQHVCGEYHKALVLYEKGNYEEARGIFKNLVSLFHDGPSACMEKRCAYLLKNGAPKDWKGIWEMDEK